jgi:hypothetical protein
MYTTSPKTSAGIEGAFSGVGVLASVAGNSVTTAGGAPQAESENIKVMKIKIIDWQGFFIVLPPNDPRFRKRRYKDDYIRMLCSGIIR